MPDISLKKLAYKCSPAAVRPFIKRIEASDIGSRFVGGAFWVLFGTIGSRLILLVVFACLARMLETTEYGKFSIVRTMLLMFLVFSTMGLSTPVIKSVAEFRHSDSKKAGRIIAFSRIVSFFIGVLGGLTVFLFSDYLASNILGYPELAGDLRLVACIFGFVAVNEINMGVLVGLESFKSQSSIKIASTVSAVITVLIGSMLGGLHGSIIGLCVYYLVYSVTGYIISQRACLGQEIQVDYVNAFSEWKTVLDVAIPVALTTIMLRLALTFSIVLLTRNGGAEEIAIYDIANQWRTLVFFIPVNLSAILLPILSSLHVKQDRRFLNFYLINIGINAFVTLALVIVIWLLSSYILLAYGKGYVDARAPLIILCFSAVFEAMCTVSAQVLIAQNCFWKNCMTAFIRCLLMVFFAVYFVLKGMGASGIAWAVLLSIIIRLTMQSLIIYKGMKATYVK